MPLEIEICHIMVIEIVLQTENRALAWRATVRLGGSGYEFEQFGSIFGVGVNLIELFVTHAPNA